MDPRQELLEIYRKFPCRTLPNAFWKTATAAGELKTTIQTTAEGALAFLAVWCDDRLMAFWTASPTLQPFSPLEVDQVSFALVHADGLPVFEHREFSRREAYFHLIHKGKPPVYNCPPGYIYRNVHPQIEASAVAGFIRSCYKNIKLEEKTVRGWLTHHVYDPELWVWIIDEESGERAALGVAERDRHTPEVSLEWIQVLPAYRGKGLGKAVVAELLRRAFTIAAFTTVSGRIEDGHWAESLYRQCGFSGSDVWWLLAS